MFTVPDSWLLENHFQGKKLTQLVVGLSALSIFFFGYDQGMMAGVNTSPDYVDKMKFGYYDSAGDVTVTNSTKVVLLQYTTLVLSLDVFLVDSVLTGTEELELLDWVLP